MDEPGPWFGRVGRRFRGGGGGVGGGGGGGGGGGRGFHAAGFVADAQGAADRVQQALQGRGFGQEFGHAGFGEQGLQIEAGGGGLVLEFAEQPARAGGQPQRRGGGGWAHAVAPRVDAGAAGRFAGGDAGHGGADDPGCAHEAVAEARQEWGKAGVTAEAAPDEADELGDDRTEAGREIRGQEAQIGRCLCRRHVRIVITCVSSAQGFCARRRGRAGDGGACGWRYAVTL